MTVNFFINGTKRESVPVYVRMSISKTANFKVKTELEVDPARWDSKHQSIKGNDTTKDENETIDKINDFKKYLKSEYKQYSGEHSKVWLEGVVYKFHHKRGSEARDLNEFINLYIKDVETGVRKTKANRNLADGTIRAYKSFQRIFLEYQGIYSPERLELRKKEEKPIRPIMKLDYEDINPNFYDNFIRFLSQEMYRLNSQGKFVKSLKTLMQKSRRDKLHTNRDYEFFDGLGEDSFAVYLDQDELDKIFNYDLTPFPRMALARDCFLILCESCLRISDYKQISLSLITVKGIEFIDLYQVKTKGRVVIPLTQRFKAILKRNGNKLPYIPDQYVNRYIKSIASWCKIDQEVRWKVNIGGLEYEKTAKKFEKISCHTGRRTGATNMYLADVPLKTIRSITGHKSDEQLLEYIKASEITMALKASELTYFSGKTLRIAT